MSIKTLVLIAVGLFLLYLFFTVGAPFMLAIIIAIFLEPLNQLFISKFRMNRLAAATVSSSIFTLLLLGLFGLLGVKLVGELIAFWDRVPGYFQDANGFITLKMDQAKALYDHLSPEAVVQLENSITGLTSYLSKMVSSLSTTIVAFASGIPGMFIFFIVFIVAVYMFSFSLDTMKGSILSIFEESSRPQVNDVLNNLKRSIFGFLRSQFILSAMTYVISLIGLIILDIKYPLAIALLIVIVDLMPILGTGSVLVPWGTYLLLTGNAYGGVGLIILFVFITVFRRIVEPKILGDAVGIGALSALISLYVGFKLVGVIGVFLGPLVIIIYMAARKAGLFQIKIRL
ncbi:sporulation integral membrane protein YtvI [Paenibacillus sp. GCM10023252]|uniref:sporulation integral membrane protein YtvI n=1 Tax=Paenibacillus sp. GCM10023252 TaxID=3252649 RepID=UPI003605AF86